jgi:hypothetical protein
MWFDDHVLYELNVSVNTVCFAIQISSQVSEMSSYVLVYVNCYRDKD